MSKTRGLSAGSPRSIVKALEVEEDIRAEMPRTSHLCKICDGAGGQIYLNVRIIFSPKDMNRTVFCGGTSTCQ